MPDSAATCPLCSTTDAVLFHDDKTRRYLKCRNCSLVFVPAEFLLGPIEEKQRYDQHNNDPDDPGYRAFLNRLAEAVVPRLTKGAEGLDFGCGPGPALSGILREKGFSVADYDPYYALDKSALERTYDFIVCSETIEHVFDPKATWALFVRLLRKGGIVGVMTERYPPPGEFGDWHYMRDPTHVRFYSEETFCWIARTHGLTVEFPARSVAVFRT